MQWAAPWGSPGLTSAFVLLRTVFIVQIDVSLRLVCVPFQGFA